MDIADKDRLAKLIGMLGSSFDGERANAARMIGAMAEKHKLTINELIAQAHGAPERKHEQARRRQEEKKDDPWNGSFDKAVLKSMRELLNHRALTPWERQFLSDITIRYQSDYELSEKQLNVCERIYRKCKFTAHWG